MMMMIISSWWWGGGGGDEISPKFHNLAYHTYWIEHWCSDKPLSEQQVVIRIYLPGHIMSQSSAQRNSLWSVFFTCLLDLSVHQRDHNYCHIACQGGWWFEPHWGCTFWGKNPMLKIGKAKERKSGGVTPVNAQLFGSLVQLCQTRYCQNISTFSVPQCRPAEYLFVGNLLKDINF